MRSPHFVTPLLCLLLAGCAVVRIEAPDRRSVEVTHGFGLVSVNLRPGSGAVIVDSTSFGAMKDHEGYSLGYRTATAASVAGDRCQLVIWIKSDEELKYLADFLRQHQDVCHVQSAGLTGRKQ